VIDDPMTRIALKLPRFTPLAMHTSFKKSKHFKLENLLPSPFGEGLDEVKTNAKAILLKMYA